MEQDRIPILKIEDFLVASIQVALHDQLAMQFQTDLLNKITMTKAKGLIIDITAIDVVDSFITRILVEIASMANLMGSDTVLVGMQPEVAITLAEFGMELTGIDTALNLEQGLVLLRNSAERNVGDGCQKGTHQRRI
ncbi:MAG: STAS domain-containing protein [Chloroflexota bacterium]|nr:STAS domain-containing protein [Chloroflexota bacterium]